MAEAPETMSQIAFAVALGVDKSNITRWKQAGLIAMEGKRVLVAESRRRLQARGLARPDVTQRFERERALKTAIDAPAAAEHSAADIVGWRDRRIKAEALRAEAQAAIEQLAAAEKAGNLIPKEEAAHAMRDIGASVRQAMENFPDQVAPLLPGDQDATREILAEQCRIVLLQLEERMRQLNAAPAQ